MNKENNSAIEITVILPTYNEKENIKRLISRISGNMGKNVEILVVDDNSPDETWKVVEDMAKENNNITLLRRMDKRGLTSALADGIKIAKGGVIAWMDTDLSMPPEKLEELTKKIKNGYDIAVGSRYVAGGGMVIVTKSQDSLLPAVLSYIINFMIQKILKSSFHDYTSGFIAIRKKVLQEIELKGDYGEYFIDLIYRAIKKGYKIIELPYISSAREYGVSKTSANFIQYLKRGTKYFWTIIRLRSTKIERKKNGKNNR